MNLIIASNKYVKSKMFLMSVNLFFTIQVHTFIDLIHTFALV